MAARALGRFPLAVGVVPDDPDEKPDGLEALDPRLLADDPGQFYATLEQRLDAAGFGPEPGPTPTSPASRLVGTCRDLGS